MFSMRGDGWKLIGYEVFSYIPSMQNKHMRRNLEIKVTRPENA